MEIINNKSGSRIKIGTDFRVEKGKIYRLAFEADGYTAIDLWVEDKRQSNILLAPTHYKLPYNTMFSANETGFVSIEYIE